MDDNVSTEKPEFFYFRDVKKAFDFNQRGPGVRWLPRLERGTVEGFARDKRLTPVRKNRTQQAQLNNRGYGMGEMLHMTDIWENGSPELIADLLSDTVEAMTGDMISAVNGGIYDDGTDTTYEQLGFQGFNSFLSGTSYAGISMSTYTNWSHSSDTGGGSPYNQFSTEPLIVLDEIIKQCRTGGQKGKVARKPDVGFMSWDLFNIIKATLMRKYHLTLPQNAQIQAFGDIEHILYGGVTWFPSFETPSGYIYCLTSDSILFEFPTPKFINEYRTEEGIPRAIYVLYIIYGRIRCKEPRCNGRFAVS